MKGPAYFAARDVIATHLCGRDGISGPAMRAWWPDAERLLDELMKAGLEVAALVKKPPLTVKSGTYRDDYEPSTWRTRGPAMIPIAGEPYHGTLSGDGTDGGVRPTMPENDSVRDGALEVVPACTCGRDPPAHAFGCPACDCGCGKPK